MAAIAKNSWCALAITRNIFRNIAPRASVISLQKYKFHSCLFDKPTASFALNQVSIGRFLTFNHTMIVPYKYKP